MTGIAITNRRMTGVLGRTVAAALLVAAGAVAGIQVARIGGLAGPEAQTTTLTAGQVAADQGWQAFRAGERGSASSLSGNAGYQVFRAGERGAGAGGQLHLDGVREH